MGTKSSWKTRRRMALAEVKRAAIRDLVSAIVEEAAADLGCRAVAVVGKNRGRPEVARARAVAMHAAIALGLPILTTAKALGRTRRAVHEALRLGIPGNEERDKDVLERYRRVVAKVLERGLTALSKRQAS